MVDDTSQLKHSWIRPFKLAQDIPDTTEMWQKREQWEEKLRGRKTIKEVNASTFDLFNGFRRKYDYESCNLYLESVWH